MDALLCNGLGIYLGMHSLKYLSMKPYDWRGLWNIPTYRGKLKRIVAQFGPHSWVQFDWRPFSSFDRWLATILIVIAVSGDCDCCFKMSPNLSSFFYLFTFRVWSPS